MENTPRGNRLHIARFGRRNAGKSSLINSLTNQSIAIVSDIPGTTTDPVYKSMEILPLGPVVIIDTAGIDDSGELGELRVRKSLNVLAKTDVVLLVLDAGIEVDSFEEEIVKKCREREIPVLVVLNKQDITNVNDALLKEIGSKLKVGHIIPVSAKSGSGITKLKLALVKAVPSKWDDQPIVGDLINAGETAVLVVPIDSAAPKGRLILPQVQIIRDILDNRAMAYVVQEDGLKNCLNGLVEKPKIVITDSQAFARVAADTPFDVQLTSFSILFARHKGDIAAFIRGARAIRNLQPGDKVLISEACTHHRVKDDIGTTKLPCWLSEYVKGELEFSWSSGGEFPEDLAKYKLIIHCGGCMINRREMLSRIMRAEAAGVPIVNYGIAIAEIKGILYRVLSPFPQLQEILQQENIK